MNKLWLRVAGLAGCFFGIGCQSEADRVTAEFKVFCERTEAVIRAENDDDDHLKVTFDVSQSTSTVRPYSATIKLVYSYKDRTATATATYEYEAKRWKMNEVSDLGPIADLREEKRRNTFKDLGIAEKTDALLGTAEARREIRARDLAVLRGAFKYRNNPAGDIKVKLLRLYDINAQITANLKQAAEALKKRDLAQSSEYTNKATLLQEEEKLIQTQLGWN